MRLAARSQKYDPVQAASKTASQIMRLKGHVEISEFKQVVFGLLLLKSLSSRKETPFRVFWHNLISAKDNSQIPAILDSIQTAWINSNPALAGIFPRLLSTLGVENANLREIISIVESLDSSREVLDATFTACLSFIAAAENRAASDYHTANSILDLMVRTAGTGNGSVYDPCCGAGGLLLAAHNAMTLDAPALIGQESNATTWNLARCRFAINAVAADLGATAADSLRDTSRLDVKADLVLANPPFNQADWCNSTQASSEWPFGTPPERNANFAWLQHAMTHLSEEGTAIVLMSSGTLSSTFRGEDQIRRRLVEADVVDCIVSLPKYQINSTRVYACLWILTRSKAASNSGGKRRQRHGEVLMIAAQDTGSGVDSDCIENVSQAYHEWRGSGGPEYLEHPGFSRSVTTSQIAEQKFILMPSRYVRSAEADEADLASHLELQRSIKTLDEQFAESARLEREIRTCLQRLGIATP